MTDADREEPGRRLESLEPGRLAAYSAFRRPARPSDCVVGVEAEEASFLASPLNPDLGRRVYDGVEGTIDSVPGPDTVCCVASSVGTGERMSGSTSTALAVDGPHGFIRGGADGAATFIGVLPAGARALRIIKGSGEAVRVPVNDDDAYWVTVDDAIDMVVTRRNGTALRVPLRGGSRR